MAQMTTDIGDGRRDGKGALHPLDPLTADELSQAIVVSPAATGLGRARPCS